MHRIVQVPLIFPILHRVKVVRISTTGGNQLLSNKFLKVFLSFGITLYIYICIIIVPFLSKTFRQVQGPAILLFRMYCGYFPGIKGPGLKVHLGEYGVKVKNEWSRASSPPVCIIAWTGATMLFAFTFTSGTQGIVIL